MTQAKNNPIDKLLRHYKLRNTKYNKGVNCEKLNDKIRKLQKETNYSISDKLGKEKIN